MTKNGTQSLADPAQLQPMYEDDAGEVRAVIETPKGSRNKYAFEPEERVFELKKVLPSGMTFPYDFGFVPSTKADDGDPVDVLVLMDEPAFPGCIVYVRPIGVIEAEQGNGGKTERNDRVIAVEVANHQWAHTRHIDDLGKKFLEELEEFFVNYHKLSGKKYRILGVHGPNRALKCIQTGIKMQEKSK
jgi:inorganic pyrophosphatase